ncbi:AAA family ATPase [Sulfidibacter corallicola]|uniref:AAA family ATPase n=1 Tax=Sulfidibacter corallicola TaxID=2818388 RepID=A0A8A4TQP0_SULCO|nr:AAA domain-containing protein [Sulfidibacter corallicola]QTD51318.1 AAA family ATPase [Sulfidibacter corallicola]
MSQTDVVRFLRECYRADFGQTTLGDVFDRKVEHKLFFEGAESLLHDRTPWLPVPHDWGEETSARAYLYRKEKQLIYACFLFLGGDVAESEAPSKPLATPLMWFPAQIEHGSDGYVLTISREERAVNDPILDRLAPDCDDLLTWLHLTEVDGLTPDRLFQICSRLEARIDHLETGACLSYPGLWDAKKIRGLRRKLKSKQEIALVPAAFAALIPKPSAARGVLSELSELSEAERLSPVVRYFLSAETVAPSWPQRGVALESRIRVPAVLSAEQQRIVTAAGDRTLTLVIGPPGTGKSFTIAATVLDHLQRGQSVLIVSKMDHAVDVVAEKLAEMAGFDTFFVRGGKRVYRDALKTRMENLKRGIGLPEVDSQERIQLDKALAANEKDIERLLATVADRCTRHLRWGEELSGAGSTPWDRIKQAYYRFRGRNEPLLWQVFESLEEAYALCRTLAARQLRLGYDARIRGAFEQDRDLLRNLSALVKARVSGRKEKLFAQMDPKALLEVFPVWLMKLSDLSEQLPLFPGMFDLAIIDEATQCDMASCVPVFQRARRLMVVGDPHQLRHLSFVARDTQARLGQRFGLTVEQIERFDYRQRSMLELAEVVQGDTERAARPFFLNEHFRSEPPIIAFSNREFYGQGLHVMTEKPGISHGCALEIVTCAGTRGKDGTNPVEAERLLTDLETLVASAEVRATAPSIGILAPFRKQADYLAGCLQERLPMDVTRRHRIFVGTAHSFQGQERDLMFLSLTLCPDYHSASLRFLERGGVLNVAVTRARARQSVYASLETSHLPEHSLLRRYLWHGRAATPIEKNGSGVAGDLFARELRMELEARGFRVSGAVSMAGLVLDMVVSRGDRSLGLDLIGYPGPFADVFPLERYQMLGRAGLRMLPLTYVDWLFKREGCLDAIEACFAGHRSGP